jgi:uncharacterized Zn finger protein (UPF0148 family)
LILKLKLWGQIIMFKCIANMKSGARCRSRVSHEGDLCNRHRFTQDKPKDCPVCYQDMDESSCLCCGHWVHRECIVLSGKLECPICRRSVETEFTPTRIERCYERRRYLVSSRVNDDMRTLLAEERMRTEHQSSFPYIAELSPIQEQDEALRIIRDSAHIVNELQSMERVVPPSNTLNMTNSEFEEFYMRWSQYLNRRVDLVTRLRRVMHPLR